MDLNLRISAFSQLGKTLSHFSENSQWPGYNCGLNEGEYNLFNELIIKTHVFNGWFTESNIRRRLQSISHLLDENRLLNWVNKYPQHQTDSKNVAIIMAGNIPLVGFHDLLCVLISGHNCLIKMSSDDDKLLPALLNILYTIAPDFKSRVQLQTDRKLEGFGAVIATGSNNSANYFKSYFGKYPNIIRKNRSSLAILEGSESSENLRLLADDIFDYFGLGCRNITKVFIPDSFDIQRIFDAVFDKKDVLDNNKYANNYDYHKALYLMNQDKLLDNGFLLVKEDQALASPIGVLHIHRYNSYQIVDDFIRSNKDKIQCIVGSKHIPFGKAQEPELYDYADGVDVMQFLTEMN